jgi:undecaprenyl-diphosphatase
LASDDKQMVLDTVLCYIALSSLQKFSVKKLIFVIILIAIGITISDQLAGIFKYGVGRLRPCHNDLLMAKMRLVTCGGQFGFYSSHSSNSFFLVSFLSILIGEKYRILHILLFWALLVSYSRIYLGVHFPLDVVYGAAVGFFFRGVFANLAKKIIAKK